MRDYILQRYNSSGRSDVGVRDAPPAPRGVEILSISCSFGENLAKSYVGAPLPWGVDARTSGKSWIRHRIVTDLVLTAYWVQQVKDCNYN